MGIVGIELVAWIICFGGRTYKARAKRHRAHGGKLVNATSCYTDPRVVYSEKRFRSRPE